MGGSLPALNLNHRLSAGSPANNLLPATPVANTPAHGTHPVAPTVAGNPSATAQLSSALAAIVNPRPVSTARGESSDHTLGRNNTSHTSLATHFLGTSALLGILA